MTSPDGVIWTPCAAPTGNFWTIVTFGNGHFVAVANTGTGNRAMTSEDGVTWTTRRSPADNNWTSVTYGGGQFVALGSSGVGNRVFPLRNWAASNGDYATDFRAFDGAPGEWRLELRADRAGSPVTIRWEGDPEILQRSLLIDVAAARTISPADPSFADGYTLTPTPATRQLVWRYLGN